VICVRNTVIEDYHSRGSLSQADMKAFNKEVANLIYTWDKIMMFGSRQEREALYFMEAFNMPVGWDEPHEDKDLKKAIRLIIKTSTTK
jgi:hypothetical protein